MVYRIPIINIQTSSTSISPAGMHSVPFIVNNTRSIEKFSGGLPLRLGKTSRSGMFRGVRFYAKYTDASDVQREGQMIVDMERIGVAVDKATKIKRRTTFGRVYAAMDNLQMQALMMSLHSCDRHLYESLSLKPTKLVLDIDRPLPSTSTAFDLMRLDDGLRLHFLPFLCSVLNDIIVLPTSFDSLTPEDFVVLDASKIAYKYSKHLIMNTKFQSACSPRRDVEKFVMHTFRDRLRDRCLRDTALREFCYFRPAGQQESKEAVDFSIYSNGKRSMRLPACCKGDGKRENAAPRLLLPDAQFCSPDLPINAFMCNVFAPDVAVMWSPRAPLATCMPRGPTARVPQLEDNSARQTRQSLHMPISRTGPHAVPVVVTKCLEDISSAIHPHYTSRSISSGVTESTSLNFVTMLINYKAPEPGGDRVCAFGCEKHTRHYASVTLYDNGSSEYFCFGCQETTVLSAITSDTIGQMAPEGILPDDGHFVDSISRAMPGCTLTQCSLKYLPSCPLQRTLARPEMCIARSGMGTGKTFMISEYIKDLGIVAPELRVVSIGFRQTLNTALATRLNLQNYLTASSPSLNGVPRLSIQLDSLPRLLLPGREDGHFELPAPYDIVIIDEIESLLTHFTSATMQDKALLCWRIFECVLSRCTKLVVCDADLGDRAISFLAGIGRDPRCTCVIRNDYSAYVTRHIVVHNVVTFTKRLYRHAVKQKRKIYLASNSRTYAHHAKCILSTAGLDVLLIEGASPPAVKAAAADCDATWGSYDVVICTPAVAAGIDCSILHFDDVFVYGTNGSNTGRELNQQRGRVRHVASRTVYVCIDTVRKPFGKGVESSNVAIQESMDGIMGVARGLLGDIRSCVLPSIAGEPGVFGICVTQCPRDLLRIIAVSRMERERSIRNMSLEYERAVVWADAKSAFIKLPDTKLRYSSMLTMEINNLHIAQHDASEIADAVYSPSSAMDSGMEDAIVFRKAKLGSFYGGIDFRCADAVFHFIPDARQITIKNITESLLPISYLFMADQTSDGAFSTRILTDMSMRIEHTVHHKIVLEERLPSWVFRVFSIILLYAAGCRSVSVSLAEGAVLIPDANIVAIVSTDGLCSSLSCTRLKDTQLQLWLQRQASRFIEDANDNYDATVFDEHETMRIARKWLSRTYGIKWAAKKVKRTRLIGGGSIRNTICMPHTDILRLSMLGVCLHSHTLSLEDFVAADHYRSQCMSFSAVQRLDKDYLANEVFLADYGATIPTLADLKRRTACKVSLGPRAAMTALPQKETIAWDTFDYHRTMADVENVLDCLHVQTPLYDM